MNPVELLTTVNGFYDQAFNRLLIMTFGIIAFIGVIIPIAVGWLQFRSLRSEKNALLNELKAELSSEREESEKRIKEEVETQINIARENYEKRFNEISVSVKKASAAATARAHHLQGNATQASNELDLGLGDFCHAATQFFLAGEEFNARRCIDVVTKQCLPKINSKRYSEHKIEEACNDLIAVIEKHNENLRYQDDIELIQKEMASASARTPNSGSKSGA